MKKILLILLLFLDLFPISCCDNNEPPYSQINSIKLYTFQKSPLMQLNDGDSTNYDTIILALNFQYEFLTNFKAIFSNDLFAKSCRSPGEYGLKDKLTDINITSDTIYNGIPKDTSLNRLFTCRTFQYLNGKPDLGVKQLLDSLNIWNYFFLNYPIDFMINTKPVDFKIQRFKITLKYKSGKRQNCESSKIKWY